ncbi:MAG: NADP-dependent oxidoreductase [Gammaproteobacteria bacterium]|nr:NADP-dependent oxidoreductase [Gammaproteobacteria bacterium]
MLRYGDLPIPEPATDEVLVRVAAAAVNPIDRRLRAGELQEYFTRAFPITPGWDFSGRIERTGSAVSGWSPGDDVLGLAFTWHLHGGTYAEYACVKAESLAAKPAPLSWHHAAALPLVSLTAWQALHEYANVLPGQSVLIQAGAGGVGSVAIPMAKHLGARVYATCGSANVDYVRGLGADHVIDYSKTGYARIIRQREPEGLDVVIESLTGEPCVTTAVQLTRSGGTVVYLNNEPPDLPEVSARQIRSTFLHHRADGPMLAELVRLYVAGILRIPPITVRPLTEAADAHRVSESGRTRGKVVLHVQDL